MKYFAPFILLLAIVAPAMAASSDNSEITNKPYIGVAAGYGDTKTEGDLSVTRFGTTSTSTITSLNSLVGNLYAGDEIDYKQFSLAGEAFFGGQTGTGQAFVRTGGPLSRSINSTRATYNQAIGFGISLLPGYYINPRNHIYGRVGYLGSIGHGKIVNNGIALATSDKYLSGYQLGAGYENELYPRLFFRLEYDFQDYAKRSILGGQTIATGVTSAPITVDPYQNVVTVGVNYKF